MSIYLKMVNIEKIFPNGVHAVAGASLSVAEGEIHALIGENAAGKSTLMNILYGQLKPDKGEIYICGKKCNIQRSADAIALGIGMVHQHFKLVPDFTILENIILGIENRYVNAVGRIDYSKAYREVSELLNEIGIELDLNARTRDISIGLQSKVEIVKALFRGAKLLILDEPTTVLAPNEVDTFFDFLRTLRSAGYTIIYISHRMKEIFALTDSITVLRKGKNVMTIKTAEASMDGLTTVMLGYQPKDGVDQKSNGYHTSKPALIVENLTVKREYNSIEDVSFSIKQGEILGVAGIEGNGQVELADSIIGLLDIYSGTVKLCGMDITNMSVKERRCCGLAYVPDDRINKGLALNATITENIIMGHLYKSGLKGKVGTVDWRKARNFTNSILYEYKVEGMNTTEQAICSLSGGNMQKVIVGRELHTGPMAAILSQPTVGIDFNAQRIIHDHIIELRNNGCAFLLISEDLDELLRLSDRILVLYRGRVVKQFNSRQEYDANEIGLYMTGVKKDD